MISINNSQEASGKDESIFLKTLDKSFVLIYFWNPNWLIIRANGFFLS